MILGGVPAADGVYNVSLGAGDDVFDVDGFWCGPGRGVRSYGYRLREYVDMRRLRRVSYDKERGIVVFDFGGVRVVENVYGGGGFIVEAGGLRRVVDGGSLAAVFGSLFEDPAILALV